MFSIRFSSHIFYRLFVSRCLPDIAFSLCGGLPTAAFVPSGTSIPPAASAATTDVDGAGSGSGLQSDAASASLLAETVQPSEEDDETTARPFSNLLFEQSLLSYDDFVMRLKVGNPNMEQFI